MMGPRAPFVVFCTAHANYAVEAFDRGAADYVLKPVDPDRLRVAIERARARMDRDRAAAPARDRDAERRRPRRPARRSRTRRSTGALVTIFTTSGERHLTDDSLGELERKLPHMLRVHRRALVALDHVTQARTAADGRLRRAHRDARDRGLATGRARFAKEARAA